jgi:rubrerythrin
MGIHFSGKETIDIAVGIEMNGAAFYDQLAGSTKEKGTRAVYMKLADREREHAKTFQNMLNAAGDYVEFGPYDEEYDTYLKTLVESAVFKNARSAREAARNVASESEALETGIQAEKDSILFYSAIQGLVRRTDADIVGAIIKEEKAHLAQLSDLKTKPGTSPRPGKSRRAK